MKHILKCEVCGRYTLKGTCNCGNKAIEVKPAKYSPKDPYAEYRIKAKEEERKKLKIIK
jgi:rRNA maturation protein Nop10